MTVPASKPYQVKAPPRLSALFPLMLSYPIEIRSSKSQGAIKRLHLDFSAVELVDALGIAIFITNIAKEIRKHNAFEFQIKEPENNEAARLLRSLDIGDLLVRLGLSQAGRDFWDPKEIPKNTEIPYFRTFDRGRQAILHVAAKQGLDGRSTLAFARKELKQFYSKNSCANINYTQVHHILDEIIKNTLDHSNDHGLTAVRFEGGAAKGKLSFVHSELGNGISMNVRSFLASSSSSEDRRLADRGSTADFLHWAFMPGHTSKPNSGVNAGLGLAHIHDASKGGNIELYFSDAQSLAYVTDFPERHSHKNLRRRLYHSHPVPCFMYFGETKQK